MRRSLLVGLTLIGLIAAFVVASNLWREDQAAGSVALSQSQATVFVPADAVRLGDPAAKVVIVEWFDPACETCARFAPLTKEMVEKNAGRVQLVLRYAPLHEGADAVVAILEASRKQDRYFETLDLLFSTQHEWTEHHVVVVDNVWAILEQSGMDLARLRQDAADPAIQAVITRDMADAKTLGVTKTPGFFVNGRPLERFGIDPFVALVQEEYRKAYP